VSVSFIHCA